MYEQSNIISSKKLARIGLYTAGLKAYWDQFEGMKQRLIEYGLFIESKMSNYGEVYNFGMVDDVHSGRAAGEWFNEKNVDILFCHSGTYFTSSDILPLHQICNKPIIILSLQPTAAMNYPVTTTGEWLAHCVACPIPEVVNAMNRANIDVKIINGLLGLSETPAISMTDEVTCEREESKKVWKEIEEWINAATVKRTLQYSKFGFLGNTYSGMLDMYSDMTMIQAQTGIHVAVLEMCDLNHFLELVSDKDIQDKLDEINTFFTISGDSPSDPIAKTPTKAQLQWSAKIASAQEMMVKEYGLDALVYYYHGADGGHYEEVQGGFIVGHSLLTAKGVPCSGEGDLKTAVGMKISDILGVGGSYSEIVASDFERSTILLGHDGPFHIKISQDEPVLRGMGLYHGKKGTGISVEANVITGNITLLGVTQTLQDGMKFIMSEGRSVDGPLLTIGNTTTHVDFGERPDLYMDRWFLEAPTHHCAMSVGHNVGVLKKIAYLMDIKHAVI